jgi:hypothetical protein
VEVLVDYNYPFRSHSREWPRERRSRRQVRARAPYFTSSTIAIPPWKLACSRPGGLSR